MKKLLLVVSLALASWAQAGPIQFENKTQTLEAGMPGTVTDSAPTYALNNVTATVASSYIDLSATGALWVCVTSTAGAAAKIGVQFGNTNTAQAFGPTSTAAANSVQQLGVGCFPIKAAGRWLRFVNQSVTSTTGVATTRASVSYFVVSPPTVPVTVVGTQAVSVVNTVNTNVTGGVAGISATASQGGGTWAVSVTSKPVYGALSSAAYTVLTGTVTSIELGAYTGATRNCDVAISVNYGANAAIRYTIRPSSSAPGDLATRGNYLSSTSTTQVLGTFAPGFWLHMQSAGIGPTGNDVTPYVYGFVTSTANP